SYNTQRNKRKRKKTDRNRRKAPTKHTRPPRCVTPLIISTRQQEPKRNMQPRGNLHLPRPTRSTPHMHLIARARPPARRVTGANSAPLWRRSRGELIRRGGGGIDGIDQDARPQDQGQGPIH